MPYSRSNALFDAYTKVDAIIQQNHPCCSLEHTFQIKPPQRDNDDPVHIPQGMHQPPTQEELDTQADTMQRQLNTEQHAAYTVNMNFILSNQGGTVFMDGPGGTGKSFVYKTLTKSLVVKGCSH